MAANTVARILDAAESLLLAYGYRKVTVDEIAARAGVGKGTAYQYWPSKRELFGAVLVRDTADRVTEQLGAVRADPAEARLHRSIRLSFLQTMRRPLAKALATGDQATLGEVLTTDTGAWLGAGMRTTLLDHLALLHAHGLLADDPAADPGLYYRLSAAVLGSFLLEGDPVGDATPGAGLTLEARAGALVTTVRRAFEPAGEPKAAAVRAAAAGLTALYDRWHAELTGSLPGS